MDTTIIDSITTLGFPVVTSIILAWYVKYQTDLNNAATAEMRKEHKEEVTKMTEAVNNNTLAIQQLAERIINHDK